jgi:hypothetical protein
MLNPLNPLRNLKKKRFVANITISGIITFFVTMLKSSVSEPHYFTAQDKKIDAVPAASASVPTTVSIKSTNKSKNKCFTTICLFKFII